MTPSGTHLAEPFERVRANLESIEQPVLCANGVHDVMVSAAASYVAVRHLESATLLLYSDAGHAFLFQHAKKFATEVTHFLADQPFAVRVSCNGGGAEAVMRYEKGHKAATKQRITDVASRRFRDEGISAVGLSGVMSDAGLTNGAFYAHFESKEDLVRQVIEQALEGQRAAMTATFEEGGLEAVVREYLGSAHRDQRAEGCPSAALLDEIGRRPDATRDAYTRRLLDLIDVVSDHVDGGDPARRRTKALVVFGSMVGTLQLARAITDEKLSADVLEQGVQAALNLVKAL